MEVVRRLSGDISYLTHNRSAKATMASNTMFPRLDDQ